MALIHGMIVESLRLLPTRCDAMSDILFQKTVHGGGGSKFCEHLGKFPLA